MPILLHEPLSLPERLPHSWDKLSWTAQSGTVWGGAPAVCLNKPSRWLRTTGLSVWKKWRFELQLDRARRKLLNFTKQGNWGRKEGPSTAQVTNSTLDTSYASSLWTNQYRWPLLLLQFVAREINHSSNSYVPMRGSEFRSDSKAYAQPLWKQGPPQILSPLKRMACFAINHTWSSGFEFASIILNQMRSGNATRCSLTCSWANPS